MYTGGLEEAIEAAKLAKADLGSSLVTEMTALAGTMGRHYALKQGLKPSVAEVSPDNLPPHGT